MYEKTEKIFNTINSCPSITKINIGPKAASQMTGQCFNKPAGNAEDTLAYRHNHNQANGFLDLAFWYFGDKIDIYHFPKH